MSEERRAKCIRTGDKTQFKQLLFPSVLDCERPHVSFLSITSSPRSCGNFSDTDVSLLV